MRLHRLLEAPRIHGKPLLLGHQLRQIQWKAIRIVELECVVSGDHTCAFALHAPGDVLEDLDSPIQRLPETLFLAFDHHRDGLRLLDQFGICRSHTLRQHRSEPIDERLVHP